MGAEAWAILLLGISFLVLIGLLILRRRRETTTEVRPLPAFQDLLAEAGYAAESGGAVHIALGSGSLYGGDSITSLAALQVLTSLADTMAVYDAPPIVTVGDPTLLPIAQDVLRRAYERIGRAEMYDPRRVRFVAPSPVAYAAGAADVVAAENVTADMTVGLFGAEVGFITDAGARLDVPQLAAATTPSALSALYTTVDRLAMGEELYAAGAQMTHEPRYLTGLAAQDVLRVMIVLAILVSALLALLGLTV
jgi:LPXTG-motif cell wall-anchored protein